MSSTRGEVLGIFQFVALSFFAILISPILYSSHVRLPNFVRFSKSEVSPCCVSVLLNYPVVQKIVLDKMCLNENATEAHLKFFLYYRSCRPITQCLEMFSSDILTRMYLWQENKSASSYFLITKNRSLHNLNLSILFFIYCLG
jgi:hypothetical protein